MTKIGSKKLLAHHHTGKLRHHHHTSYGSLALILFLAVMPLVSASRSVSAAATDNVTGQYGTYAVVAGPTPKDAPTIANLSSGKVFITADPVPVRGVCQDTSLVKIFKNEVFAGAATCQGGSYQLSIDLFVGNNSLIARQFNANDVASPDSAVVTVQLQLPGIDLGSNQLNTQGAPAGQFYATSEQFYRAVNTGEMMSWKINLAGGQAPYAVSVSWGDGQTELLSRGEAGQFEISHAYSKAADHGGYAVIVKSTDQAGNTTYIQLVALVNGEAKPAGVVGGVKDGYNKSAAIKTAWQVLAVTIIVVLSFWLGEKRQAKVALRSVRRMA